MVTLKPICPQCLNEIEYRRSSFEQYQPSVFYCKQCDKEFQYNYIMAFNYGYSRAKETT